MSGFRRYGADRGLNGKRIMPLKIEFAWLSDIGQHRSRNEDSLAVDAAQSWAVLADGMGGCRGGEVASRLVVEAFREELAQGLAQQTEVRGVIDLLRQGVVSAQTAIVDEGERNPRVAGMGSTVVALVLFQGQAVYAHLGDSRLYRLRNGELTQLTIDHSTAQYLIDHTGLDPDMARFSVFRNFLTRGLGGGITHEPDIGVQPVVAGDRYLLCSDGLTDMVEDADIARIVMQNDSDLSEIVENLVGLANSHGGRDNVSVIVASAAGD